MNKDRREEGRDDKSQRHLMPEAGTVFPISPYVECGWQKPSEKPKRGLGFIEEDSKEGPSLFSGSLPCRSDSRLRLALATDKEGKRTVRNSELTSWSECIENIMPRKYSSRTNRFRKSEMGSHNYEQ